MELLTYAIELAKGFVHRLVGRLNTSSCRQTVTPCSCLHHSNQLAKGFVSDMRRNLTSNVVDWTFSTFGQVVFHLPRETRSFVMGLHQLRKPSTLSLSPGPLSFSPGHLNHGQDCSNFEEHPIPSIGRYRKRIISEGSIALVLESSLDENTTFGCWVETNNSNPGRVQWSVNLSGDSKDELGWGFSLSGTNGSPECREPLPSGIVCEQIDLRPGVVHVMDGNARITAFILRSHWSL